MTFLQKTVFISFILLLSGCSAFRSQETTTNIVNPNQWKEHKQKVSQLDTWQIKGKAAIRTEKESGSGTFFWLQKKEYFDIRLSGPLGRGSVRLAGRPGNIVLDEANKGSYTAASPEELLKRQLNLALPVSNLYWWIRGIPMPNSPTQLIFDDQGQLQKMAQDDWFITYSDYKSYNDYLLPGRVKLKGHGLNVILVLKEWKPQHLVYTHNEK